MPSDLPAMASPIGLSPASPRLPNFLVLGAMKAGTTALYYYLRQHPQIYLNAGRKEAQFFCNEGRPPRFTGPGDDDVNRYVISSIDEYRQMFAGAGAEPAVGEVGTVYLYVPGSEERIRHHVPDARLFAILRDPVERAYSSFLHLARERLEPCRDFAEAVRREPERRRQGWSPHWHYLEAGFYADQVRRYLKAFDRHQLRFYLYDDYAANPVATLQDMFRFLRVDDAFVPDVRLRHNVAGVPRSHRLHHFLDRPHLVKRLLRPLLSSERRLAVRERLRALNLRRPPRLRREMRRHLIGVYQDDVHALEELLERDLSPWLDPERIASDPS